MNAPDCHPRIRAHAGRGWHRALRGVIIMAAIVAAAATATSASAVTGRPGAETPMAKHPTHTTVTVSPASLLAGTAATFTAVVTSGGKTPGGKVSFYANGQPACSAHLAGGQANCQSVLTATGAYTITGRYSGDRTHQKSSGSTSLTVYSTTSSISACVSVDGPAKDAATPVQLSLTLSDGTQVLPLTGDVSNGQYYGTGYSNCGGQAWNLPLTQTINTSALAGATFTVLSPGHAWHGEISAWADDSANGPLPLVQTADLNYNDPGNSDACAQYRQTMPIVQYSFVVTAPGSAPATGCGQDPGVEISLMSAANHRYVAPDPAAPGAWVWMLRATDPTFTTASAWVEVALSGQFATPPYAFRSLANGLYASAEVDYPGTSYGLIRARASVVGLWEQYYLAQDAQYNDMLQSAANADYVSTELGWTGISYAVLRARATVAGPWEKYEINVIGSIIGVLAKCRQLAGRPVGC